MALAERYLNTDLGTGLNDGTSEANAWQTWAAAAAGLANAQRLNIKAPASRTDVSASITFNETGVNSDPVAFRAYASTIGDGGIAQYENLSLTFSGTALQVEGLDILNGNSGNVMITGSNWAQTVYNCKFASTSQHRCVHMTQGGNVVNCYVELGSAVILSSDTGAIEITNGAAYANIVKCAATTGSRGAALIRLEGPLEHNVAAFRNLLYCTTNRPLAVCGIMCDEVPESGNSPGFFVVNNTIADCQYGIYVPTTGARSNNGTSCIANNLIAACPISIMAYNVDSVDAVGVLVRNAYDGAVASGMPNIDGRRLTADPFTDRDGEDFSLNSDAGGGSVCRARAASLNGTLDIGALAA